jgi:hypothetical protein
VDNRELDALVAEHIFGWTWWRQNSLRGTYLVDPTGWAKDVGWEQATRDDRRSERWYDYLFHWSTDIAAAWEVVEAMRAQYGVEMGSVESDTWRGWYCEFCDYSIVRNGKAKIVGEAVDNTLPLAICRAALRAKGIDVEHRVDGN